MKILCLSFTYCLYVTYIFYRCSPVIMILSLIPLTIIMLASLTREELLMALQLLPGCITIVF